MSSAIPAIISPVFNDNKCYVDGGILCNYPILQCIENVSSIDEILGFKNKYTNQQDYNITEKSTIIEFFLSFIEKFIQNAKNNIILNKNSIPYYIPNEIICEVEKMNLTNIRKTVLSQEVRKTLIENGTEIAKQYLANIKTKVDSQVVVDRATFQDNDNTIVQEITNDTDNILPNS
jgi:predicted acylesterase/phospholipase RssA